MSFHKALARAQQRLQQEAQKKDLLIIVTRTKEVLARFPAGKDKEAAIEHCRILDERNCGIDDIDLVRDN